ncbi:LOW QUALITY PROTEIN: neurotensin receptor type 2 [Hipposideros larvatus]
MAKQDEADSKNSAGNAARIPPGVWGPGGRRHFPSLYSRIFSLCGAGHALSAALVLKARAGPLRLCYRVLSLALSSLLLLLLRRQLVSVPMELLYSFVWFHHPVSGDLGSRAYYFMHELCADATAFSIASLNAEHCLALCQPLCDRHLLTPHRTRLFLSLVWAISSGLAMPMAITMGQKHGLEMVEGEREPATHVCTMLVTCPTLQVFIQEW